MEGWKKVTLQAVNAVAIGLAISQQANAAEKNRDKPNIIILLADDMGWGDTSYNGNPIQKTPHLDQMAKEGLRFDRFYAACAVCAPTRASVMTGQNGARLGISHWGSSHVNANDVLIAEIMKDNGYATGHFGKWHLGLLDKEGKNDFVAGPRKPETDFSPPWINGFDVCFSTENVTPTWDPMKLPDKGAWGDKRREKTGLWGNNYWNEKGEMIDHNDNLSGDDSRVMMDRVIPFVKDQIKKDKPFFAYVCFHTPHTPTISGGKYLEMYKDEEGKHHYGAITAMDDQIGRLRKVIKELGQEENTLVWFTTDNGAMKHGKRYGEYGGYGSNKPFKGWKLSMYEGGIRVPTVMVYPKLIKKPAVTDVPCMTSDMLPTLAAIIGDPDAKRSEPQDGIDILPVIMGTMKTREKPMGFVYKQACWMTQDYKLILPLRKKLKPELYQIINDPYETTNLADSDPERVREMGKLLIEWLKSCNTSCGGRYKPVRVPSLDAWKPAPKK